MTGVRDLGLHERVKILAGILPTKSHRALEYMRDNVSGMIVPDALIARLKGAEEPAEEGIRAVCELIAEVREIEGVSGVHLMPVMWESATPRIVEEAGLGQPGASVDEPGGSRGEPGAQAEERAS